MLGYSKNQLTKSEIWITAILYVVVGLFFISYQVNNGLPETAVASITPLISFLTVPFLFPKVFYHLNIDFGNVITTALWFGLMLMLYMMSESSFFIKIPVFMFIYLQAMRILHFLSTNQLPTYKAHWASVKTIDKQANRRISDYDVAFAMLHGLLPVIIAVAIIWWNEVFG